MPVDPNQHDEFVLRQRIRPVVNQYEFTVPEEDGSGRPVSFVEQKRFKLKEDIRFFTDDTKAEELMRIKARKRFDPRARYDVTDANGAKIGGIQKLFGKSLLRSTYAIYGPDGEEVALATEANPVTAVIRRVLGFIPFIGEFAELIPIPYDFHFLHGDDLIGINRRRRWKLRDIYDIDMTADTAHVLDRRLVLAITVGMDALQAR